MEERITIFICTDKLFSRSAKFQSKVCASMTHAQNVYFRFRGDTTIFPKTIVDVRNDKKVCIPNTIRMSLPRRRLLRTGFRSYALRKKISRKVKGVGIVRGSSIIFDRAIIYLHFCSSTVYVTAGDADLLNTLFTTARHCQPVRFYLIKRNVNFQEYTVHRPRRRQKIRVTIYSVRAGKIRVYFVYTHINTFYFLIFLYFLHARVECNSLKILFKSFFFSILS